MWPKPGPGDIVVQSQKHGELFHDINVNRGRCDVLGDAKRPVNCQAPITPGHAFVAKLSSGEGAAEKYGLVWRHVVRRSYFPVECNTVNGLLLDVLRP